MTHTALETFWEQIAEILPSSVDSETAIKLYEKYQEAKQIEKVQIMEAYVDGYEYAGFAADSEHYYNITYGNNQNK